ncbi:MAG: hypothetical protein ACT443_00740 [Gemmatimonadota bacterium]
MFCTIRRYRVTGSVDEAMRRIRTDFVPQIQRIPRLISYSILVAGETLAAVSVFEDVAAAEESNRIAALWVKQHMTDLIELPAQITAGEVLLHVTPEVGAHV